MFFIHMKVHDAGLRLIIAYSPQTKLPHGIFFMNHNSFQSRIAGRYPHTGLPHSIYFMGHNNFQFGIAGRYPHNGEPHGICYMDHDNLQFGKRVGSRITEYHMAFVL